MNHEVYNMKNTVCFFFFLIIFTEERVRTVDLLLTLAESRYCITCNKNELVGWLILALHSTHYRAGMIPHGGTLKKKTTTIYKDSAYYYYFFFLWGGGSKNMSIAILGGASKNLYFF